MNNLYEKNQEKLIKQIQSQKIINKFRILLYSVNKEIRNHWFNICKEYIDNEMNNNSLLTALEKNTLMQLSNRWQWANFENNSTEWWKDLSYNYNSCDVLMKLMNLWIDNINDIINVDADNSTLGLR
jgi:hypothetical protein